MSSYYEKNKEKLRERAKQYYQENKDKIRAREANRTVSEERKEYLRSYGKKWRSENQNYANDYQKERRAKDPLFRLIVNIRTRIWEALDEQGFTKRSKSNDILGCGFDEFKEHLEKQFEPWMTWENYGLYNGEPNYGWDVDHIIPVSTGETEEEIINLNNHKNLKPLCSYYNRNIKKNKVGV